MDLIEPLMYLVIAFSLNAMLFLLRRRLPWDWPMVLILAALTGSAIYSISQGDAGIYLALGTLLVGFVIAEVPGRFSKRSQWARIQGNYRKAHRNSLYCFLLQPTAYNRVLVQMMKLVVQVKHRSMSYKSAQEKLQKLQSVVEQIPNVSIHTALWESLYAFAATQEDWPKLTRNYNEELYPIYCEPPSGAGYYMVQALCEEERYAEASAILQGMKEYVQDSKMIPEESEIFHNKARLLWLAHMGYHRELQKLFRKDSALYLLFPAAQRNSLLHKAESTDKSAKLRQLEREEDQREMDSPSSSKTEGEDRKTQQNQDSDEDFDTKQSEKSDSRFDEKEVENGHPSVDKKQIAKAEETEEEKEVESQGGEPWVTLVSVKDIPVQAQQYYKELQGETYLSHDFVLWGTATQATMLMLMLNILIYVVMSLPDTYNSISQVISSLAWKNLDAIHLMRFGGCHPGIFQIGEGWRLFSGNFLHAGILHITFNSYFLLLFGPLVERFVGPWRFTNIYLLSGLAGFLTALWSGTNLVLVGASASIFGVFGATFVVLLWMKSQLPQSWYRRKMLICVILFILNSYLGIAIKAISFSAHMGGFVTGGLIAAALLWLHQTTPPPFRRMGVLATLLLWLPLALWTGERVYTTSQQSLTTRLNRLQPLGARSIPMLLSFRESSKSKAPFIDKQIHQMGSTARKALFQLLEKGSPPMQSMATDMLGHNHWKPKMVTPGLYAHLSKAKTDLKIYILHALHQHKFQAMTPQQIQNAVKLIVQYTKSKRSWVQKNALWLLYYLGPWAKAAAPILKKVFTQHPDPKVRSIAGVVLFKFGPKPYTGGHDEAHRNRR